MEAAIFAVMAAYGFLMGPGRAENKTAFRLHWGLLVPAFLFFGLNVLMERGVLTNPDRLVAFWMGRFH